MLSYHFITFEFPRPNTLYWHLWQSVSICWLSLVQGSWQQYSYLRIRPAFVPGRLLYSFSFNKWFPRCKLQSSHRWSTKKECHVENKFNFLKVLKVSVFFEVLEVLEDRDVWQPVLLKFELELYFTVTDVETMEPSGGIDSCQHKKRSFNQPDSLTLWYQKPYNFCVGFLALSWRFW